MRYLTPAQVAELLQVSPRTISRWALQDASMPCIRLPGRVVRFEEGALLRWLERKRQGRSVRKLDSSPSSWRTDVPPQVQQGGARLAVPALPRTLRFVETGMSASSSSSASRAAGTPRARCVHL